MKLIPILPPINDLGLGSTNVAEGEMASAFNPATNYVKDQGASVGTYGGLITTYLSLHDNNLGNYPATSPASWKRTSSTYMALTPDLLPYYVFKFGDRVLDIVNHRTMEAKQGTQSVVTISIGTPAVVSWADHALPADTPIVFESTGIMPAGLSELVTYYVKSPLAGSFNLSATPGGAAINTTGSGVTDTITATANPTFNKPLDDPESWLDIGPSNRWGMFDNSPASQTTNPESIIVRVRYSGRIDTLAFLNVSAASIDISIDAPELEEPITRSYLMTDNSAVHNWYDYYFAPIVRKTDLIVDDLIPYSYGDIIITINAPGGVAAIGALVAGLSQSLGDTEIGMRLGIQDYSKKSPDPNFGSIDPVERGYANRGNFTVYLPTDDFGRVKNLFVKYRAKAALWVPDGGISEAATLGFYKDFTIEVSYHEVVVCSLEIEGVV